VSLPCPARSHAHTTRFRNPPRNTITLHLFSLAVAVFVAVPAAGLLVSRLCFVARLRLAPSLSLAKLLRGSELLSGFLFLCAVPVRSLLRFPTTIATTMLSGSVADEVAVEIPLLTIEDGDFVVEEEHHFEDAAAADEQDDEDDDGLDHNFSTAGVEVRDVWRSYGSNQVLRGLSMSVRRGTSYGLLGPSGCGKTSLLKVRLSHSRVSVSHNVVWRVPQC